MTTLTQPVAASTPPELFFRKDEKFQSLGSFYSGNFCDGSITIDNGEVRIYCRSVPDIGPMSTSEPQLQGIYPCQDGQIHGLVTQTPCGGETIQMTYVNGRLDGEVKYFFSDGKLKKHLFYCSGKICKESMDYAKDGSLLKKETYNSQGMPEGEWYHFNPYTKVGTKQNFVNGNPLGNPEYIAESLQEPLILAAGSGDLAGIKSYLEKGADINSPGDSEYTSDTAIHAAAQFNQIDILTYLLDHGGNPNVLNKYHSKTPLISGFAHSNIVQILLNYGADPNLQDPDGKTVLHEATRYGYVDSVEILLKHNANPDIKNKEGKTPLDLLPSNPEKRQELLTIYKQLSQ